MKKAVWGCVVIAGIWFCTSCEFSFGEKQTPVFKGTANPDAEAEKKCSPEKLAEAMKEDLSDRGWKHTKTVINLKKNDIEKMIRNFPAGENAFQGGFPKAVIVVPYIKEQEPRTSVTLTFCDMGTPFSAFSAFSRARQQNMQAYYYGERECILRENSSVFWEGPYLISVVTANLSTKKKDILLGVSKGISYKLYGLIGTYEDPEMTSLFPSADRKDHSIQVLAQDPFHLKKPRICMKAEYSHIIGKRILYIYSDDSGEKLLSYRKLLTEALMDSGSAVLASERNESLGSRMWINSVKHGIVEIALWKKIIAVETGVGAYHKGITQVAGLRDIALSDLNHKNFNKSVDINPYKNLMVIKNPKGPADVIPLGSTIRAVRNAKAQ